MLVKLKRWCETPNLLISNILFFLKLKIYYSSSEQQGAVHP